jgi:hypothetical protein
MRTFAARRWRNLVLLTVVSGVVLILSGILAVSLRPAPFYSGWVLAGAMLVLAAYNLFKKAPFLPLGASATWLQLHIYLGLLAILLFLLHARIHVPHGLLGWILAVLFAGVAGSGLFGLVISRNYPTLLRARGPEVIFEQIPVLRRFLREEAEKLILGVAAEQHSTAVADFYLRRLKAFFEGPRHFWRHAFRLPGSRQTLLTEIDAQDRYLNDKEREAMRTLGTLVERKDDLDFQYALQALLKCWLFVHIPLTYSLLIFVVLHVLVVYAYAGVIW